MKCPRCKNEVARLTQHPSTAPEFPDGLCDTCDAVARATDVPPPRSKAGTQFVPPLPPPVEVAEVGPGVNQPRVKRPYVRRPKPEAPPPEKPPEPPKQAEREPVPTTMGILERIRLGYSDELRKAEEYVAEIELKLQVANDIIAKVREGA